MTQTAMVFGGAGFIGRPLCRKLVEEGVEILCVDNYATKPEEEFDWPHVKEDATRPSRVESLLRTHKPETIFWLPAKQGYEKRHSQFANLQVKAVYALFEAIDAVKDYQPRKIIFASSQAVYEPRINASEDSRRLPPSVYGFSKVQQEDAFGWFSKKRDIDTIGLRYSIVFGQGQALQSSESGLLRNWYRHLNKKTRPLIFGDGDQERDFVHVDDVTRANWMMFSEPITNAAMFCMNVRGFRHTVNEAFEVWQEQTGCKEPHVTLDDQRPGGEYSLTSSGTKILNLCGWRPEKRLPEQIQDFLEFNYANQ